MEGKRASNRVGATSKPRKDCAVVRLPGMGYDVRPKKLLIGRAINLIVAGCDD